MKFVNYFRSIINIPRKQSEHDRTTGSKVRTHNIETRNDGTGIKTV